MAGNHSSYTIDWIKQTTLHDVIMNNTGISLMQDNVFLAMPHSEICANMTADVEGVVTTESGTPIVNRGSISQVIG
ncbi:hypothetical protein D5R40_35060 [Okeania hirsuta]|uniref:Uncharacterized protein n=1 Tax=Okeania hirsuta TaxID=1458930 RepID=A0A3N6N5N0_9CYAN|nr:hypothetical protein D5R40_35060 [Okeania hirsuta]